jgi:hypothetical protein
MPCEAAIGDIRSPVFVLDPHHGTPSIGTQCLGDVHRSDAECTADLDHLRRLEHPYERVDQPYGNLR